MNYEFLKILYNPCCRGDVVAVNGSCLISPRGQHRQCRPLPPCVLPGTCAPPSPATGGPAPSSAWRLSSLVGKVEIITFFDKVTDTLSLEIVTFCDEVTATFRIGHTPANNQWPVPGL